MVAAATPATPTALLVNHPYPALARAIAVASRYDP